ncbi:MAG: cytidylate kinase-like family protein [Hominisplanchenecus sp.]|nr:cytidylate kinase-like family protein [Lachnospiraceae bacterium]MDY2818611.1 cytidylate kinase-like family protein [Hominisplanchenecus sp.]
MAEKRIITISRTFGSGGRMIGTKLAEKLGYSCYDKNLLELLSEKTGISEQGLMSADEKLPQKILDHYVPSRVTDYNTSLYLFKMESQLIRELAEKECCVFIGRLADWILKDRKDVLNVFITAPDDDRVAHIMETEGVTEAQAQKLMMQIDKMRNNYYSYFTDRKWQHTKDRDLIINSSLLGIDGTAGMLEYIIKSCKNE